MEGRRREVGFTWSQLLLVLPVTSEISPLRQLYFKTYIKEGGEEGHVSGKEKKNQMVL